MCVCFSLSVLFKSKRHHCDVCVTVLALSHTPLLLLLLLLMDVLVSGRTDDGSVAGRYKLQPCCMPEALKLAPII